jgi:Protein of unknown function (DUF3313)
MKRIVIPIISLGFLGACANQKNTQSGFLNNYQQMQSSKKGAYKFSNPILKKRYTSFIIDDVQYTKDIINETLSEKQISELKNVYRDAITKAFSDKYTLVSTPSSNTIRIRLAITGVSKAIAPLNYLTTVVLFTPVSNGGISTESEVVDSLTGKRLAALSTHTNSSALNGAILGYYTNIGHAKSSLKVHAIELRKTLITP